MYSTPAALQAAASSSLILREASLMSVSPLQKRAKPSPVPGPSTVYSTSGFAAWKSSATMLVIGSTVDEPEMVSVPTTDDTEARADSSGGPVFEQAASSRAPASSPARPGWTRAEWVNGFLQAWALVRLEDPRWGLTDPHRHIKA